MTVTPEIYMWLSVIRLVLTAVIVIEIAVRAIVRELKRGKR